MDVGLGWGRLGASEDPDDSPSIGGHVVRTKGDRAGEVIATKQLYRVPDGASDGRIEAKCEEGRGGFVQGVADKDEFGTAPDVVADAAYAIVTKRLREPLIQPKTLDRFYSTGTNFQRVPDGAGSWGDMKAAPPSVLSGFRPPFPSSQSPFDSTKRVVRRK